MVETKEYSVVMVEPIELDCYDLMLKKFPQWTNFNREIKLNTILNDKKLQYNIDDINTMSNALFGVFFDSITDNEFYPISRACFAIKSMHFTINKLNVEKIILKIQILTTENGKVLKSLIDSNVDINIRQFISNNKVQFFYIDVIRNVA